MEPVKTPNTNCVLKGDGKAVIDLPVTRFEYADGTPAVESCWELTEEDLERIIKDKKIYFICLGNTHPPIWLHSRSQVLRGNEHCVRECEKQGPCEVCNEFKKGGDTNVDFTPAVEELPT